MDSSGNNIQFRSVPLVQRGDLARLSSVVAAERVDATQRRPKPVDRERESGFWESESSRAGEPRRRRDSADEARPLRTAATDTRRSRFSEYATPDFGASRLPEGQTVSAHMGESGVVGVTRRSERRSGLRLVPNEPPTQRFGSWGMSDAQSLPADMDVPYERTRRSTVRESADYASRDTLRRPSYIATREDLYEDDYYEDDEYYEDDDFYEYEKPRRFAALAERRDAVVDGVMAIPGAIASSFLGFVSHLHIGGLVVLVSVALAVCMLYSPACDLYIANRKLEALQQTYDELVAENEQIKSELEQLQTREGIENEARARGYVEPGEVKVKVNGLPEEEAFDGGAAAVEEAEYIDNRAWYVRLFDTFFGYEPEA